MKSLEHIKNEYAVSVGFEDWKDFTFLLDDVGMETHMDNICIIAQKECLKRASESIDDILYLHERITNENNIIK